MFNKQNINIKILSICIIISLSIIINGFYSTIPLSSKAYANNILNGNIRFEKTTGKTNTPSPISYKIFNKTVGLDIPNKNIDLCKMKSITVLLPEITSITVSTAETTSITVPLHEKIDDAVENTNSANTNNILGPQMPYYSKQDKQNDNSTNIIDNTNTTENNKNTSTQTDKTHNFTPAKKVIPPHPNSLKKEIIDKIPPRSISFLGEVIPYINSWMSYSAPKKSAGLWYGGEDINDGSFTFLVGHNPGIFHNVMNLKIGDNIRYCNSYGDTRDYKIVEIKDVPDTTQLDEIMPIIESYGESLILQTCVGDNKNYRLIFAI